MVDIEKIINCTNRMVVIEGGINSDLFSIGKTNLDLNAWMEHYRNEKNEKITIAVAPDEFEIVSKSISDECTVIKSEKVKQFFSFEEKERYEFLLKNYDSILVEAILRFEESRDNDNFTFGNAFDIAFVDLFLMQKQLENKD